MSIAAADRYWHVFDALYGAYLDSVRGFALNLKHYAVDADRLDSSLRKRHPDALSPSRETSFIAYGRRNSDASTDYVHSCTVPRFLKRNAPVGANEVLLGRMLIISAYQYWDSEFRQAIADEVEVALDRVMVPVFGDLRRLRNAILHGGGRADGHCGALQVLRPWAVGVQIEPDQPHIDQIAEKLLAFVEGASAGDFGAWAAG